MKIAVLHAHVLIVALAGCATPAVEEKAMAAAKEEYELFGEFERPEKPDGLSGITRVGGDRYYAVDDSDGMMYELRLTCDEEGVDGECEILSSVKLGGRRDLEGCAFDPLTGWLWVSDESDTTVNAYDPKTGEFRQMLEVPREYVQNVRINRSLESLTISPDGKRLYFANEDTLKCDGDVATREHGGKVRVQEFTRESAADKWRCARRFYYETDPLGGDKYKTYSMSSLADMAADAEGSLYFLERELSIKDGFFPTFRCRIYRAGIPAAGATAAKTLVYEADSGFANYEGMTLGAPEADGSKTFVLISDGDGPAVENFAILKKLKQQKGE